MQSSSLVPAAELFASWSAVQHIQALGQMVAAIRLAVWSTGIPPTLPQPESPSPASTTGPIAPETIRPIPALLDLIARLRASALQFWVTARAWALPARTPVIPRMNRAGGAPAPSAIGQAVRFLTPSGGALRRSSNPDKTETR